MLNDYAALLFGKDRSERSESGGSGEKNTTLKKRKF
jgi:hypothetical protein